MNAYYHNRRGGSFLILQDVMGWATGFFILCLGEGQQKTVSTETDFAGPTPPVLYDQSLTEDFSRVTRFSLADNHLPKQVPTEVFFQGYTI